MKKLIHKQVFDLGDRVRVAVFPTGAKMLHAACEFDEPKVTVWYEFDPAYKEKLLKRRIYIVPTGPNQIDFDITCHYLTTVFWKSFVKEIILVYHIYVGEE